MGSSQPNAVEKFNSQKSLVKSIIERMDISRQAALPAFVLYGPIPTLVSRIGEITDKQKAMRTISSLVNNYNSSDISSALTLVDDYVFSLEQGARPNVQKSILLFVDKTNTGDQKVLNGLSKKFKDQGTKFVVIAVGDEIDKEALKPLTHNNGAVFFPPSLEELERMIEPVSEALKPGTWYIKGHQISNMVSTMKV